MKVVRLLPPLLIALSLLGCAGVPVSSDFDESQNFGDYQSFSWLRNDPLMVAGGLTPTPATEQILISATREALESKGFRFVEDSGTADFLVALSVGTRDKTSIQEFYRSYGPNWGWGSQYYGGIYPMAGVGHQKETLVTEYTEGTLSIDIFDVARKSPVWHGSASKRLSDRELRGDSAESTRVGVKDILASFPPGQSE